MKKLKISSLVHEKLAKHEQKRPIYEILFVIITKGEDVQSIFKKYAIKSTFIRGSGTANSALTNLLGLYEKDKDVYTAFIPAENSKEILDDIENSILSKKKHCGIAFTIPLKCATKDTLSTIKGGKKHE